MYFFTLASKSFIFESLSCCADVKTVILSVFVLIVVYFYYVSDMLYTARHCQHPNET